MKLPVGEDEEENANEFGEEVLSKVLEETGEGDEEEKDLDEGVLESGQKFEGRGVDIFVDGVGQEQDLPEPIQRQRVPDPEAEHTDLLLHFALLHGFI